MNTMLIALIISIILNLIFAWMLGGPPHFVIKINEEDEENIKVEMEGNVPLEDLKPGRTYRLTVRK
jgi:hypothetical protein